MYLRLVTGQLKTWTTPAADRAAEPLAAALKVLIPAFPLEMPPQLMRIEDKLVLAIPARDPNRPLPRGGFEDVSGIGMKGHRRAIVVSGS